MDLDQVFATIEAHYKGSFRGAIIQALESQCIKDYRAGYNLARACKNLPVLGPEGLRAISQKVYDLTILLEEQAKAEGVPAYRILDLEVRAGFTAGLSCSAFGGTKLHSKRLH